MDRIWKDVSGYNHRYQVSNDGKVRSCFFNGMILSERATAEGYLRVRFCIENKTKLVRIHRLVAIAFIPNPENKAQVNHIDGDKKNNNVENLEWATSKENIQHAIKIGLIDFKSRNYSNNRKLTDEQVIYIRKTYKPYSRQCGGEVLAKMFNMDTEYIRSIARGNSRKNV